MSTPADRDAVTAALEAITGRPPSELKTAFSEVGPGRIGEDDETPPDPIDVDHILSRISTRLGLAPAVSTEEADRLRAALPRATTDAPVDISRADLRAWDTILRHAPEYIPTLEREPVVLPVMPAHQVRMWQTLLALEKTEQPWVLVGGQMTVLHCLENDIAPQRATDDGDVVIGVWTRRDALKQTSDFLRSRGFDEDKTNDGYGYRFRLERDVVIDVLLPEGLERQRDYPTTVSGRPGFSTVGGNQALSRAVRLPITVDGTSGYVRRPTLLGAIVAKAHAFVADSRDPDRHAEDIVILAELALRDPRTTLRDLRPDDRRPVRRFMRELSPSHRYLRAARDPEATHALLSRIAETRQK